MMRLVQVAGYFLAVLLLAGCGSQGDPEPLRFNAAPWSSGEVAEYQVVDADGVSAGTARITLTAGASANPSGWTLQREVSGHGDREVVVVEMAGDDFRPYMSTLVRISSDGVEQVRANYSFGEVNMELTSKLNVTTYEKRDIPSDVRDQRALVAIVRALPLAPGYWTNINTYFPITGLLERVSVRMIGEEQISVPAGTYTTWHVDLELGDSSSQLWLSQQAPFPMVKFVDGRSQATYHLINFQAGS